MWNGCIWNTRCLQFLISSFSCHHYLMHSHETCRHKLSRQWVYDQLDMWRDMLNLHVEEFLLNLKVSINCIFISIKSCLEVTSVLLINTSYAQVLTKIKNCWHFLCILVVYLTYSDLYVLYTLQTHAHECYKSINFIITVL